MTGYELLKNELYKTFHKSKVDSNMPLIEAVVRIVAENKDANILLDTANKKLADAEEMQKTLKEREEEVRYREIRTKHQEIEIKEQEKEVEHFKEKMNAFETADARDKARLAYLFKKSINVESSYDNTAAIKGLAWILGTPADDIFRADTEPKKAGRRL